MINKYFSLLDGVAMRHANNPRLPQILAEQLEAFYECGAEAKGIIREWEKSRMDNRPQILVELEDMLKKHDRYYMYSDDHRVWRKGNDESQEIQQLCNLARKQGLDEEVTAIYKKLGYKD